MNLFEGLLEPLPEGRVVDLRVGLFWTGVVSEVKGQIHCGLASTLYPEEHVHGEALVEKAGHYIGEKTKTIASMIYADHGILRSIGLAALNSIIPLSVPGAEVRNAEQIIATLGHGKKVVLVGHFPFVETLRKKIPNLQILELRPSPGDLPATEAENVIPVADVVAITSMALINHTFEGLLALVPENARVMLIGPSTPLSPFLFNIGVDVLCGCVVENIPQVLEVISQGGNFRQVHRAGAKLVNLYSERVKPFLNESTPRGSYKA